MLFSATYPDNIKQRISSVAAEAQQISVKTTLLRLDHVKQFIYKCPPKGKAEFLANIFETCSMTSSIVFVNSKSFAETLYNILRKKGLKPALIFGNMENKERDEMMENI